jgi:hypothetical protein
MAQKTRHKTQATGSSTMGQEVRAGQRRLEEAARATRRFQEDAAQWWTRIISQTGSSEDWKCYVDTLTKMAAEAVPMAQRRMSDVMGWMEKSSRVNTDLVQQALRSCATPVTADGQNQWMQLWTASMKALQTNVEAASEASTRAMDAWIGFVRKSTEDLGTARAA